MESRMADPALTEANLATMKRAFEALARKDLDACVALLTPDFKINLAGVPYQASGHKAWLSNAGQMIRAFPDLSVHIDDMFASGDKVTVRVRFTGTQTGDFLGVPPSGKRIDYESQEIYRFEDGKLAEEWICSDTMTMMTQIGAVSPSQLILVWLGSFRLWIAAAGGVALGSGLVLLAQALLP
jgi:steroid delta-isomerase-like uncharacterized protein